MMWIMLALGGCEAEKGGTPIAFCEGEDEIKYEPDPAEEISGFPDDHWTVEDPTTGTGRRVAMRVAETPGLAGYPENFVGIYDDLSTLDGFGLTAGIWMHAWRPLPEGIEAEDFQVFSGGVRYPVALRTTDGGSTVLAEPLWPLPEASEVVAILRNDPAEPGCVAPSPYLRRLLDPALDGEEGGQEGGQEGGPPEQAERWRAALAGTGVPAEEVAGMLVFTTQSATALSRAVAEDVRGRGYVIRPGTSCADTGAGYAECEALLDVQDYRGEDGIVPEGSRGEPQGSYALPIRIWTPIGAAGPWPVALCGHGLGGDRGQCRTLAGYAAPYGIAVVATDAVEHGDHPERTEQPMALLEDLAIFAMSIDPPGLNSLRLRDNFRQSAWDRLQVVEAIRQGIDLDGDGAADLSGERMTYTGVSLGAIMGPQLMAHAPEITGGALVVGGGQIASIIEESATFSVLVDLMRPQGTSDGEVDRFFPLLQAVIDSADPAVYGGAAVLNRWDGEAPDVLIMLAHDDQIIPNSSSEALARAIGAPLVGTEVWAVEGLESTPAPTWENLSTGATGGVVQYDQTQPYEGAPWEAADHSTLHASVQGQAQLLGFLEPLSRGDVPVINEPARPEAP